MQTVILDADSLGEDVDLDPLRQAAPSLTIYGHTEAAEVDARISGIDIVVVNKVKLNEAHFVSHPQLKLIAVTATGTNNIDMEAAAKFNIKVCNVVRYGTPTIVQHVYSMILALSNHLLNYQAEVSSGAWQISPTFCLMNHSIRELSGLKMGIVGYGDLGKAVAAIAPVFGLDVLIGARPGTQSGHRNGVTCLPLEKLLAEADVLSLHCLLSDQTRNMIDAKALKMMKKDALLINVARGGLVDEQALANALKNHELGGAGFDVLSEEPPVKGNALLDPTIPNLILTPHCAWASLQARQRLIDFSATNIRKFIHEQTC